MDKEEQLGEGGFSYVYKAYPFEFITEKTYYPAPLEYYTVLESHIRVDLDTPYAVKVIDKSPNFTASDIRREYEHAVPYISMYPPAVIKGVHYIVMECLPGFSIQEKARDNIKLIPLSFIDRVNCAFQISLAFNSLGHSTPRTGKSLIHRDIKDSNIIINIVEDVEGHRRMNVRILDFGLSQYTDDEPDQQFAGTLGYHAKETAEHQYSVKSDVYALTPVMMSLFGAMDPFFDKAPVGFNSSSLFSERSFTESLIKSVILKNAMQPFCSDAMFRECAPPIDLSFAATLTKTFIQQMGAEECSERPTPDNVLRFFNALYNLTMAYKAVQRANTEESQKIKTDGCSQATRISPSIYSFFNTSVKKPELRSEPISFDHYRQCLINASQFSKNNVCVDEKTSDCSDLEALTDKPVISEATL